MTKRFVLNGWRCGQCGHYRAVHCDDLTSNACSVYCFGIGNRCTVGPNCSICNTNCTPECICFASANKMCCFKSATFCGDVKGDKVDSYFKANDPVFCICCSFPVAGNPKEITIHELAVSGTFYAPQNSTKVYVQSGPPAMYMNMSRS